MSERCPICELGFQRPQDTKTTICPRCHMDRFYNDDPREIRYRRELKRRIAALKDMFKTDYKEEFHETMVIQMIRGEIMMEYYERLISNNQEESGTPSDLLNKERNHWRHLAEMLHMTLRSILGDTRTIKHDIPEDFKEYMRYMMKDLGLPDEEEKPAVPVNPDG